MKTIGNESAINLLKMKHLHASTRTLEDKELFALLLSVWIIVNYCEALDKILNASKNKRCAVQSGIRIEGIAATPTHYTRLAYGRKLEANAGIKSVHVMNAYTLILPTHFLS
jgi:hypothetical protein